MLNNHERTPLKRTISIILTVLLLLSIFLPFLLAPHDASAASKYKVKTNVVRIFGRNRYETSNAALFGWSALNGRSFFPGQEMVIANGDNFPDALSGAYLAYVKKAPLVLINRDDDYNVIPMMNYNFNHPEKVYLLGGTSVISKDFETILKKNGINVKRLAGADRYETNLLILKEAGVKGKDILVSSGKNYADALSGSGVKLPIMLVGNSLTNKQKQFLAQNGAKNTYILGGEMAVSKSVEKQLKQTPTNVTRLGGANRYETSYLVAKEFYQTKGNTKSIFMAYAKNFPDALTAGPMATKSNSPIFLVDNSNYKYAEKFVEDNKIIDGVIMGGTSLVSDKTVEVIMTRYTDNVNEANPGTSFVYSDEHTKPYPVLDELKTSSEHSVFFLDEKQLNEVSPQKRKMVKKALMEVGNNQHCVSLVNKALQAGGVTPKYPHDLMGNYTKNPEPGDVCFYSPTSEYSYHVSLYIGWGMSVHGGSGGYYTVIGHSGFGDTTGYFKGFIRIKA